MLSQDAGLFPHLVEYRVRAVGAAHLSRAEVANRVDKWMAATEVAELWKPEAGPVVGGQAQRVATRGRSPRSTDSVAGRTFPGTRRGCGGELQALLRSILADRTRITVMMHDLVDAVSLAGDVLVLDGGVVVGRADQEGVDQSGKPVPPPPCRG